MKRYFDLKKIANLESLKESARKLREYERLRILLPQLRMQEATKNMTKDEKIKLRTILSSSWKGLDGQQIDSGWNIG